MYPLSVSDIPGDIIKRIAVAADQLYEEGDRSAFPTVDAVRRKACVNMNDASNVMRAWRRAQSTAAAPLTSSIPTALQEANHAMLTALWNSATNAANTNLQTAQAGWEQERAEAEACRLQLATAFDGQTEELSSAQQANANLEERFVLQGAQLHAAHAEIDKLSQEAHDLKSRASTAEIRSNELAQRAEDLKAALAHAHAGADQARDDAKYRTDAADATITQLRDELRQTKERAHETREELAHLRGQVEAMARDGHENGASSQPIGKERKRIATSTQVPVSGPDHNS
jgi:colicin import membrane protein